MKFRKKPVEIEAMQYTGSNRDDVLAFTGLTDARGAAIFWHEGTIVVRTLEGDMTASPGDWIIRGVAGEVYPCKPDIFDRSYDTVMI
jgi:hypothetical protein